MGTLQIRIDEELKDRAKRVYESLGFDLSSAIRAFLTQSVKLGGFPFPLADGDLLNAREKQAAEDLRVDSADGTVVLTLDEINEIIRQVRRERNNKN